MELTANAAGLEQEAKHAAVQATKARKLRDKLFTKRMEELAAELCQQYVQSAHELSHSLPKKGPTGQGKITPAGSAAAVGEQRSKPRPQTIISVGPPTIPQDVIHARIAKLQAEIHAAVAEEAERGMQPQSLRPSPRRHQQQQAPHPPHRSGGGVLSSRALRGTHTDATMASQIVKSAAGGASGLASSASSSQNPRDSDGCGGGRPQPYEGLSPASISARMRLNGDVTRGALSSMMPTTAGHSHHHQLPNLTTPRTFYPELLPSNVLSSAYDYDDLRPPMSVGAMDPKFRAQRLFASLDVLLDGNSKVLSLRSPRLMSQVECGLRAVPTSLPHTFAPPVDVQTVLARDDIQRYIPSKGYLEDYLEKKRIAEDAKREECLRRAETGWSARDVLMGDALKRKKF